MSRREQRGVFGEVADDNDRIRPGYPGRLVDDVLAAAGPGPILEVGAGTGKATTAFAARGADLTCVEPDPRMAGLLRRKVPGVPIVVSTFEDWTPDRRYAALISGQAWHWVDPERAPNLAFEALAPNGLFAPFWNSFLLLDPALHKALARVDARHGLPPDSPHHHLAAGFPAPGPFDEEWGTLRLDADHFPHRDHRRYHSARSYSTADYRTHLHSISMYRMLPPPAREAAVADTASVIDAHGGTISFEIITDVVLARRT